MATLYGKGKGKSKSKKPDTKTKPLWCKYSAQEVEALVVKLAKAGKEPSKIGLELRDTYGIPSVKQITKKSVKDLLKEKNLLKEIPYELTNLINRAEELKKHFEKNRHDMTAKRGLQLTESKIARMTRYYKRKGMLNKNWKYKDQTKT